MRYNFSLKIIVIIFEYIINYFQRVEKEKLQASTLMT